MIKKILLPFTGGLDSTAYLLKMLKEDVIIQPVRIKMFINDSQLKAEEKAANDILEMIKENINSYNAQLLELKTFDFTVSAPGPYVPTSQVLGVIYGCFTEAHYNSSIDEVHLCYVCHDHALSYLSEIKDIWDSMWAFSNKKDKPKLCFPCIKVPKVEEVAFLLQKAPEILNKISFCEDPNFDKKLKAYKSCTKCLSCKRMTDCGLDLSAFPLSEAILAGQKKLKE